MSNGGFRLHLVVCICACAILISGCGLMRKIKETNEELSINYPSPEHLNFDPETTGIMLIDAKFKRGLISTMSIDGAAIINIDYPDQLILSGSFKTGGFLSGMSKFAVFANLVPGRYRIVKIKLSSGSDKSVLFMPLTQDLEIEIVAGKPVYHGRIVAKVKMFSRKIKIEVEYSQKREAECWEKVVDKYKESPWNQKINERIKILQ